MALFKEAYDITRKHEGGYVDDPDDNGKETYKGISRKFNPDWDGWLIIDGLKDLHAMEFGNHLTSSEELNALVEPLYKKKYWDAVHGDHIPNIAQSIANELFDTGVNASPKKAIMMLQEALNVLNGNQKKYTDIDEDGIFGDKTFETLILHLNAYKSDYKLLYKVLNILQGRLYLTLMRKRPDQEKYIGWFNRVEFIKS